RREDSSLVVQGRQTARSFACAEDLWAEFEALAQEEGCSADWLINEAMRVYAQQRQGPIPPRQVTFKEASTEPSLTPSPRERNTPTIQRSYLPKAPPASRRSPP